MSASYTSPVVEGSYIPNLVGLNTFIRTNSILDCRTLRWHMICPGEFNLEEHLPPGSASIQGTRSPSGHWVVPCDLYDELYAQNQQGGLQTTQISLPVVTSPSSSAFKSNQSTPDKPYWLDDGAPMTAKEEADAWAGYEEFRRDCQAGGCSSPESETFGGLQ